MYQGASRFQCDRIKLLFMCHKYDNYMVLSVKKTIRETLSFNLTIWTHYLSKVCRPGCMKL